MARKAVQGYTEKSYYDNTKFLGMMATSDPLQEGYFRQLVNFDIAETGLSLKPRQGYLTTGLISDSGNINVSDSNIIYKDEGTQQHVIYDFTNNIGYKVNLDIYNLEQKRILINGTITNVDFSDVLSYLQSLDSGITQVEDYLTAVTSGNVVRITDSDGVVKHLIKCLYDDGDFVATVLLGVYYRPHASDDTGDEGTLADTLVFTVIDFNELYSYDMSARNIAAKKSIIPNPLQTLYTADWTGGTVVTNRPDGHINTLGLMYVRNDSLEYYLNFIERGKDYTFIPHFELNPASIALNVPNNEVSNEPYSGWAFKFELWSTDDTVDLTEDVPMVYSTPWFRYDSAVSATANSAAPILLVDNTTVNITGDNRRFLGSKFVITLAPSEVSKDVSDETIDLSAELPQTEVAMGGCNSRDLAWYSVLDEINSYKEVLEALETLAGLDDPPLCHIQNVDNVNTVISNSKLEAINTDNEEYFSHQHDYTNTFVPIEDLITTIKNNADYAKEAYFTFLRVPYLLKNHYIHGVTFEEITTYYFFTNAAAGQYVSGFTAARDAFSSKVNTLHACVNAFSIDPTVDLNIADDGSYILGITSTLLQEDSRFQKLRDWDFFKKGYHIRVYMYPYEFDTITGLTNQEKINLSGVWDVAAYTQAAVVQYSTDPSEVTTIQKYIEKDGEIGTPTLIQSSDNYIVFENSRLVVWNKNKLFISEDGDFNYFKEINMKSFGERIVKVIEYKTILLVFTVAHVYAVYPDVATTNTQNSNGSSGVVEYAYYASSKVLYNLYTNEKYADAIQVYNDGVLYYSDEGQLYLIRPNTMIDSDTRFTLKYFNGAVNDILLDYPKYINERLRNYYMDRSIEKDEVVIHTFVSSSNIKIFYTVPGVITYILVYDVIHNRYTAYDTLSFNAIQSMLYTDDGPMYITKTADHVWFTAPYKEAGIMDNQVDVSVNNSFIPVGINAYIDSGNMGLNNHLRKRFREGYITFKNLNASQLLFNIETELDGIISHPFIGYTLEVHEIDGANYYVEKQNADGKQGDLINMISENHVDIVGSKLFADAIEDGTFAETNGLFALSEYTSSKLITNRVSILGLGKVFRLKLDFVSKGDYRLLGYGIIYKERRV